MGLQVTPNSNWWLVLVGMEQASEEEHFVRGSSECIMLKLQEVDLDLSIHIQWTYISVSLYSAINAFSNDSGI